MISRSSSPNLNSNIATNFLYMLKGEMPDEFDAHVLDVALILQADHELNASTFTAQSCGGNAGRHVQRSDGRAGSACRVRFTVAPTPRL